MTKIKSRLETWKTIVLNRDLRSAGAYRKALQNASCGVTLCANEVLDELDFSTVSDEVVELVLIPETEVGFECIPSYKDITDCGNRLDLDLCSAEIGLQLLLQSRDKPLQNGINIAMKPIKCGFGLPWVFFLREHAGNKQVLDANSCSPSPVYFEKGGPWLFRQRMKS